MSCYVRDGQVYCKDDYFRLFARRSCSRCQNGIYASELVMRVRDLVFHLHCFTCAWCNAALTQGDVFGLRGNLVYCRHHYDMVAAEEATEPDRFAGYGPFPVEMPPGRKGRPRKKKAVEERHAGMSPLDPGLHLTHLDGPQSSPPLSSGGGRTKRMRTSFKHHQLRTMKSYFALNQNPDAKDLKQLAQKTGLSKRVLQVWFQNARAKWRRNNIKQELMPGLTTGSSDGHSPQLHHHSHQGAGLCSPGSSYSEEPSPLGGVASDCSTQVGGPSMEFDSSNPLTPLVGHHGMGGHMTTFPEIY